MKTNERSSSIEQRQAQFSTLWVFAMFNYLYCDVLAIMDPAVLRQYLAGTVAGMPLTQGFLLGAGILMEIPTAMILLSRILPQRANRLANIIAGALMTAVQVGSLFISSPTPFYVFFSAIEIACTAFIVWYAWTWTAPEGLPSWQ